MARPYVLSLPPIGICEIRIALAAPRPGLPPRCFRQVPAARPETSPQIPVFSLSGNRQAPPGHTPEAAKNTAVHGKTTAIHSQIRKTPRGASGARVRLQSLDRALGGASDRLGLCSRGIRPHPIFSPSAKAPSPPPSLCQSSTSSPPNPLSPPISEACRAKRTPASGLPARPWRGVSRALSPSPAYPLLIYTYIDW